MWKEPRLHERFPRSKLPTYAQALAAACFIEQEESYQPTYAELLHVFQPPSASLRQLAWWLRYNLSVPAGEGPPHRMPLYRFYLEPQYIHVNDLFDAAYEPDLIVISSDPEVGWQPYVTSWLQFIEADMR